MDCLICLRPISDESVPVPGHRQLQGYLHPECLRLKILQLSQDPRTRKLLEQLVSYEESHPSNFAKDVSQGVSDSCWGRELGLDWRRVNQLISEKVVAVLFQSNKNKEMCLVDREITKEVLLTLREPESTTPFSIEVFSPIVGYDDLKRYLTLAINGRRKVNFLLEGPPSSGKTLFLMCLQEGLGNRCYFATGSRVSDAGLTEALLLYQPEVLLLDEVDKMEMKAYSVLLSLMETGDVLETKYHRHGGIRLDTIVVGALNSSLRLPPELLDRFEYHLHFPAYTCQEFLSVVRAYLGRNEEIDPDLAEYIAQKVWERDRSVRTARAVARMLTKKRRTEVDQLIQFLQKYS